MRERHVSTEMDEKKIVKTFYVKFVQTTKMIFKKTVTTETREKKNKKKNCKPIIIVLYCIQCYQNNKHAY